MINKILLTGDNLSLIDKISSTLETYSERLSVKSDILQGNQAYNLQADEVLFYIQCDDDISAQLWNEASGMESTYITSIPDQKVIQHLSNPKLMALQRHLMQEKNEGSIHLGELKNNIQYTEPHIRSRALFVFDCNAIRSSELIDDSCAYPSGLMSEDATQLFRYAGMNELNKLVVINNASAASLHLLSQFIWYYGEAASLRFPDHPYFTNTVSEYVVEVNSLDLAISFYKSKASGRWWVKVPEIQENKWKSCSYQDYLDACEDHLNPNLLEIISAV